MLHITTNLMAFTAQFRMPMAPGGFAGTLFFGVLMLCLTAMAVKRARRTRDIRALAYVEQAIRLNLPITTLLNAAVKSERGNLQEKLASLENALECGEPVSLAVATHLRSLPDRYAPMLEAAEQTGSLAPQLARILDEEQTMMRRQRGDQLLSIAYPVVITVFLLGVLGMASLFIGPKFARIFEDFELDLPTLTVKMLALGEVVGLPLMGICAIAVLLLCARAIVQLADKETRNGLLASLVRRVMWYLPVTHGLERNQGLADVFELLADATETGETLPQALENAASLRINPALVGRINRWQQLVSTGRPLAAAAREAGLPALAAEMLGTAEAAGTVPQVSRFLARYFRSRFSRIALVVRATFMPSVILVLAVLVGMFTLMLFLPLAQLISSTAASAL